MALLLPVAMEMEPYSAFAFLIGMAAVTTTSDTLPAVLFGVPGTVGSAATVMDGHPLARQGQAGRALGAAYTASLLGGLCGALLLALFIPVARPLVLALGSPELLAVSIVGLSMVAALSGNAPLKGLIAAAIGLLLAMVGSDPASGYLRWTFGTLYMWDGLPLIPIALGLFAIPELADMAIHRAGISRSAKVDARAGQMAGVRDVFRHWWLVLRCSWIGAALGAIPGVGAAVIDWFAYAHAQRTESNSEGFGKGDIRGVIASESANNAKEGGALVPTIVFGVPGSATMAILLGAFMIHGLVPGPEMLGTKLDVTYTIVWSLALANVLGAGICLAFSNQLARIAEVRIGILLPLIMAIVAVAAYQGSRHWGDFFVALGAGLFGWFMKQQDWPRAPLILGFVLGDMVERYLFISVTRYEWAWLGRPLVMLLLGFALITVAGPLIRGLRRRHSLKLNLRLSPPRLSASAIMPIALAVMFALALIDSVGWRFEARIGPQIISSIALACALGVVVMEVFAPPGVAVDSVQARHEVFLGPRNLPPGAEWRRATVFFGMWLGLFALVKIIGMLPAVFIFVGLAARFWGGERIVTSLAMAVCMTAFVWGVFEKLLAIPWPLPLVAEWFPVLRGILQ
jgi:TctA family transporter